jgi:ATP-dependent DNA helicase RecG
MAPQNIELKTPANRLVIGDVGSGKTLVALMSLLSFLESFYKQNQADNIPYQIDVAFMAPTEVLAAQHYQKLQELIQTLDLNWLDSFLVTNKNRFFNNQNITKKGIEKYLENTLDYTNSSVAEIFRSPSPTSLKSESPTKTEKTTEKESKFDPKPRLTIWIGTQALLFLNKLNPALVITDEQHRFGVKQRQLLTNSSNQLEANLEQNFVYSSHFVSMTATPIPRTLALTVYGDLKASYVKKIATRTPIQTKIIEHKDFESRVLPVLKSKIELGQKVYVICPSIEADESGNPESQDLWTLADAKKMLQKYFKEEMISSLHGKLATKHDILEEFKNNPDQQILISTTVIEVGVDVWNATVMLILNPERFGLAQLHQIRGRIGRNDLPENFCFLLIDESHTAFLPRLRYLCQSTDGFEIAQEDLRLRGQGDLFGTTQSGQGEELTGLELDQYQIIRKTVDALNMVEIQTDFPKLAKYLEIEANQVWGE